MNPPGDAATHRSLAGAGPAIQTKLTVSQPNDRYEQEADRVADEVMRMPDPSLSRKPALSLQPVCPGCEDEQRLHRRPSPGDDTTIDTGAAVRAAQRGGSPLPPETRSYFEPRFGYDFSGVSVHTDSDAASAARSVSARAYTLGSNVVFGAGEYAPETLAGRKLLAHELTHVVQQKGASALTLEQGRARSGHSARQEVSRLQRSPTAAGDARRLFSRPEDAAERQADQAAERVAGGRTANLGTPTSPHALLSLEPTTWFRGYADGVARKDFAAGDRRVHDLGNGLYMTDDLDVAHVYADMRIEEYKLPTEARRVVTAQLDLDKLNVLDLTKDPRLYEFMKQKPLPGADYTHGDLMKVEGGYAGQLSIFYRKYKIDPEKYQVIIGPELFRGGRQLCIRDPALIERVSGSFVPAGPRSPGGASGRGSGGGGGEGGEGSQAPNARGRTRTAGGTGELESEEGPQSARARPRSSRGSGSGDMGPSPRRVAGTVLLHVGAGLALGLFQSALKEKIAKDLAELPKPRIDRRGAKSFLEDPDAAAAAGFLDLFNKNMTPFRQELDSHHQVLLAELYLQLFALALKRDKTPADSEDRLQRLADIDDQLGEYDELLGIVLDNLDAILEKEVDALHTRKAADDLTQWLKNGMVASWLIHQGFSLDEISAIESNLAYLSASITMLFGDTHATHQQIERLRGEVVALQQATKQLWWEEFGRQVERLIAENAAKRAKAVPDASKRAVTVNAPVPEVSGATTVRQEPMFRNSDEMGMYYHLRTRESELLQELHQMELRTPADWDDEFDARDELLRELSNVRRELKQRFPQ